MDEALAIQPEFLKTHGQEAIVNYSEWPAWAGQLAERLRNEPGFEIVTEPALSLFSFRHLSSHHPSSPNESEADGDAHNLALLKAINDDGRIYLTQTRVDGRITIRFQAGPFDMTQEDAETAFRVIVELSKKVV